MEIVKINLENEMDLMLAYKRSMKLAELCGLSVLSQTSFATAVSEIARCVIRDKDLSTLHLGINVLRGNKKELTANIASRTDFEADHADALKYAKRLSENLKLTKNKNGTDVQFVQAIGLSGLINENRLEYFINYFKTEPPISPYDELRRKNIMLLEFSEKLRASENRYRDLTKTLPLMIFTTNSLGNINYGNKWFMDFFKLGEIMPDKLPWQSLVYASDSKNVRESWDKSLLAQGNFSTQARLKTKEKDEYLWHLISITPVKNDLGQLLSWAGFFVDIHAQKLVEETLKNNEALRDAQRQLLKYQTQLEEKVFELNRSNHDLEQFAYIASHDLQEPLRKIRTFSNLVSKNIDHPENAIKYLAKIESSSARMVALIKDVLNYSKLIKADTNFIYTDLGETLKNVQFDMELAIEEKKAVIEVGPLPGIIAVPQQIYQLFYNLMGNALKFNNGHPHISIKCESFIPAVPAEYPMLQPDKKYVRVHFKDNGIGFDEKYSNQIFTIFKRLNSREAYEGTGIGLALCKKIVDNHHGVISVKSALGAGTEFQVILPVA